MEKEHRIPAWRDKSLYEKVVTAIFVLAAVVAAWTFYRTVFVDYTLWPLEAAAIAVMMITDALVRWRYADVAPRIEMCIGCLVMVLMLAAMWL